jgi:hypothetical protein
MNTTHRTVAAVIAGIVSLGAGLDAAAANRPSPDIHRRPAPAVVTVASHRPAPEINKRPKPAAVTSTMPCPAADDLPQCGLHRTSDAPSNAATPTSLRSTAAASGGAVTMLSPDRVTSNPR